VEGWKIRPNGPVPKYANEEDGIDAGADLLAAESVTIKPGEWQPVPTGIGIQIPKDYEGQVRPRSGLAMHHGVTVLNSPGTIDPGYRGEIAVLLINHGKVPFHVSVGDRIAQLLVAPCYRFDWLKSDAP